jgi:hypothetical protein
MRRPEQDLQRTIVKHLQMRGVPNMVYLHPANGGLRTFAEASIFSGLGVRPGASDLLLWHSGKSFALELKAKGGRVSPAQRQFLADMKNAGAYAEVAVGLDDALAILEHWQLLRGKTQ